MSDNPDPGQAEPPETVKLAERILEGSYRPDPADARLDALCLARGIRALAAQLAQAQKDRTDAVQGLALSMERRQELEEQLAEREREIRGLKRLLSLDHADTEKGKPVAAPASNEPASREDG